MSSQRTVLVCFAMKEEIAAFQKFAAGKSDVMVLVTGIGQKNAEMSVREFFTTQLPGLVLTCGFAGGLSPDLKPGEVVFELPLTSAFAKPTADRPALSPLGGEREPGSVSYNLEERLRAAGAKAGRFFCANRIAVTAVEKKKLREETGADAVEMESAAIHAVCAEHRIPCATVRVISDTVDEDLPLDFNRLAGPDMNLDYGKLALAIAKSPGKIGALMALQKQTKAAAEKLAAVLSKVL